MNSIRIQQIKPSATIEMEGTVAALKEAGVDVISLNAGEPDFDTPENICRACTKAMQEGQTKYVTVSGILPLKKAICAKLLRDNHVSYEPSEIVVSTGAKQALYNAIACICNPGDEVIIPTPCWVSYEEIVHLVDAKVVLVPTHVGDFQLDLDAIRAASTPKTKAIISNSPNNPTGAVYPEASLRALARMAVEHDFYIVSDEVYEKLIYGEAQHFCPAAAGEAEKAHTIVINGFSKAFAMTGWRLGYCAATKEIARGIASLQGHTTSNSTTFVQWAGVEALNGPQDSVATMVAEYARRREYMLSRLQAMPDITCGNADGAFYLMPDVSRYFGAKTPEGKPIQNSLDFCNYILEHAKVAIVPGAAFEAPNSVRIAYSNSMENIAKGMDRFEQALHDLKV